MQTENVHSCPGTPQGDVIEYHREGRPVVHPVVQLVIHFTQNKKWPKIRVNVNSWTLVCQAPLSMEFLRQEYWSGCHFLLQGIFPTQESNPCLLH